MNQNYKDVVEILEKGDFMPSCTIKLKNKKLKKKTILYRNFKFSEKHVGTKCQSNNTKWFYVQSRKQQLQINKPIMIHKLALTIQCIEITFPLRLKCII